MKTVLSGGSFDHVPHVGAVRHATRQSRGGAMLLIGRAQAPRLHEKWRKHREAELSIVDPTQEVCGIHKRPPTYLESLQVPTMARGREASAKRSQQSSFNGTDVVPVVAPPCSTVEVTGHQVHLFVKHHRTNCKKSIFPMPRFLA